MKHLSVDKNYVELTKESLSSFIASKVNACGREVKDIQFYLFICFRCIFKCSIYTRSHVHTGCGLKNDPTPKM